MWFPESLVIEKYLGRLGKEENGSKTCHFEFEVRVHSEEMFNRKLVVPKFPETWREVKGYSKKSSFGR